MNLNQNSIKITRYNSKYTRAFREESTTISADAEIEKIYVDILGKKGKVLTKHGEPLSLLPEKN